MASRRWRPLSQAERILYLTQRTIGEVRAAEHGTLTKRIVQRSYHRRMIRGLRKLGIW